MKLLALMAAVSAADNTGTRTNSGNYDADDYDDIQGTIRIGGGCYTNRAGWGCVDGARCGYWEYDGDANVNTNTNTNTNSGNSGNNYVSGTCVDEDTCGDDGTGSYDDYEL